MPHYRYLLVGGGMTAAAAVAGIRDVDPNGTIGLIGQEPDRPYNRPPLSKALWKGKSVDRIWRKEVGDGVELCLGRAVTVLDLPAKRVRDDQGADVTFDKLLLATGVTPRRFPFGDDEIIYFRTVADYHKLRALSGPGRRIGVIGGGFIGSELAAALTLTGSDVVMIFPGPHIGAGVYPPDLAAFVTNYYVNKGVTVLAGRQVTGVERSGAQSLIHISEAGGAADSVAVDGVVAGIGAAPNDELARQAGLAVDNGVVVDEFLGAGSPGVYAAGDVAAFMIPALGRRMRVEHEDNANTMGRAAGRNMTGAAEPYHHLPFFYSDLFEFGYEAVGEVDARLETVADWTERFKRGVIYYLRDGRVRGALLWNVWEKVPAARELIAAPAPVRPQDLIGRIR